MSEVRYPIVAVQRQRIMEAVKKLQREKILLADAYMALQRQTKQVEATEQVVVETISDVAVEVGIPAEEADNWEFRVELLQFVPHKGE